MTRRRTPANAAEVWIPATLDDICGNGDIVREFKKRIELFSPVEDVNTAITGEPGTGKTSSMICYLRQRLGEPRIGYEDDSGLFAVLNQMRYSFIRMDGGSRNHRHLTDQVDDAVNTLAHHAFVLIDEGGELYFQGLDEMVRPMLDHPRVTAFMTAQNYHHRKKRSDTEQEDRDRLKAFLGRFKVRLSTQPPTEGELADFIAKRLAEFEMRYDKEKTIELLAKKANGVVRYAMACLTKGLGNAEQKLTYDLVMRYSPDPSWE